MKIKRAAIIDRDGTIYEGCCHGHILQSRRWGQRVFQPQMGFVTECGKFVGRELAAQIAFENGQIEAPVRKLFSEDLNYPGWRENRDNTKTPHKFFVVNEDK